MSTEAIFIFFKSLPEQSFNTLKPLQIRVRENHTCQISRISPLCPAITVTNLCTDSGNKHRTDQRDGCNEGKVFLPAELRPFLKRSRVEHSQAFCHWTACKGEEHRQNLHWAGYAHMHCRTAPSAGQIVSLFMVPLKVKYQFNCLRATKTLLLAVNIFLFITPTERSHLHLLSGHDGNKSTPLVLKAQIKWISYKVRIYIKSLFLLPSPPSCCAWNISVKADFVLFGLFFFFLLFSVLLMWAGFLFPLQNLTTHLQWVYSGWLQVSERADLVKGVIHSTQTFILPLRIHMSRSPSAAPVLPPAAASKVFFHCFELYMETNVCIWSDGLKET